MILRVHVRHQTRILHYGFQRLIDHSEIILILRLLSHDRLVFHLCLFLNYLLQMIIHLHEHDFIIDLRTKRFFGNLATSLMRVMKSQHVWNLNWLKIWMIEVQFDHNFELSPSQFLNFIRWTVNFL